MAVLNFPCERCGFEIGEEKGRHQSEWHCFQAIHRAAVEDVKELVVKAADVVVREYGAAGTPEDERIADAFKSFSNTLLKLR